MKSKKIINWFVISIIFLPVVTIASYFWANGMISALYDYRSPLASGAPEAMDNPNTQPLTRKVVLVLIDALRYDTSTDAAIMPYLNELRGSAAVAVMYSRPPSFSAPGWTTILSGAWPDINDAQVFNPPEDGMVRTFTQDDIFSAADRAGLGSALSGYSWFGPMLAGSGVDMIFTTPGEDMVADRIVVDQALPWLGQEYKLVLIHLDQLDYAGHHQGGAQSPQWDAAALRVDNLLREIVNEMDLEQDTLIVISDHGQINIGGHGGNEEVTLTEPFVAVGAGIIPGSHGGIQMVDIAPTIAVLLGTSIPASNQGRPLFEFIDADLGLTETYLSELKVQQAKLYDAYTQAIEETTGVMPEGSTVAAYQLALEQARMRRLGNERVMRNLLSLLLVFVPAYMLIIKRQKIALLFLTGGLSYFLVFNFRYLVLDQKTYSVSSITGVSDFIIYTAVTALLALLVSWLLPMIALRAFTQGPRRAAVSSLQTIWFFLYLLSIPILLNFSVNGLTTSWTLPEFTTQFLGFFSAVQALMVSALGLLLTGISVVLARISKKPN